MDNHSKIEKNVISNPNRYRVQANFRKVAGRCNRFLVSCLLGLLFSNQSFGSGALYVADSTIRLTEKEHDTIIVNDFNQKSSDKHFLDWVFEKAIKEQKKVIEGGNTTIEYYRKFEGKIIAGIRIKPLAVFGPTFADTTRLPSSKIESFANKINFSTNQKVLRKNIWFRKGDAVDPYVLSENEQYIRDQPYIQDVCFPF
jgi:hypothetical protein